MFTQISWKFIVLSGFKMANFEANFHTMMVGTSNCPTVDIKIMTTTVQTEANGKFGKEKEKKKCIFFDKTFF